MTVEEVIAKAADDVRRVGWSATGVMQGAGDPPMVPFTYTTGFRTTWGHPDVIVSGLPAQTAHLLLAEVAARLEAGDRFERDKRYAGIVQNYEVEFRRVAERHRLERMSMTKAVYGLDSFDALQMVWPDKEGRFLGEPGYSDRDGDEPYQEDLSDGMVSAEPPPTFGPED